MEFPHGMTVSNDSLIFCDTLVERTICSCESVTKKSFWRLRSIFLSWLIAFCFCCTSTNEFFSPGFWTEGQKAGIQKIENPLRDMSDWPAESTAAKRSFRITVPTIAYVLHLNIYGVYVLQWMFGFLILALTSWLSESLFGDRVVAFLATLYVAAIYPGSSAFLEYWTTFDTFGYAFLIWALIVRRPVAICLLTLLASFTDERALIASPTIILFHAVRSSPTFGFRLIYLFRASTYSVIIAWIFYFSLRLCLARIYHLSTPTVGVTDLRVLARFRQLHLIHMGFWGAFEAGWIFFALAVVSLWRTKERCLFTLWLGTLGISFAVSLLVTDITRSVSYVICSLFFSLLILSRESEGLRQQINSMRIRKLFLYITVASLVMLNYRVFDSISTGVPLPVEAAKLLYSLKGRALLNLPIAP